jgi:hypothetical protein
MEEVVNGVANILEFGKKKGVSSSPEAFYPFWRSGIAPPLAIRSSIHAENPG